MMSFERHNLVFCFPTGTNLKAKLKVEISSQNIKKLARGVKGGGNTAPHTNNRKDGGQ